MAQALAVLEQHRITHRDLKPGNVILGEHGPELIDFGIAHPEDATSLTATGLVTGSPSWLSPEQATLEPTGPPSDIFALGSLLAYAATGRPPFGEGASVAVLMSIATREPDLVGIDPNRAALLQRMLAKDPARRPTARQVLDRLRGSTTGGTTLTDTPEPTIALGAPGAAAAASLAGPPTTPPAPAAPTAPGSSIPPGALSAPVANADVTPGSDQTLVAPPASVAPPAPHRPSAPHRRRPPSDHEQPATPGPSARARPPPRSAGPLAAASWWSPSSGWRCWSAAGSSCRPSEEPRPTTAPAPGPPPAHLHRPRTRPRPRPRTSSRMGTGCWRPTATTTPPTAWSSPGRCATPAAVLPSADLTTWVYLGEESLGSVSTTVTDVPAGRSVQVTMKGDAVWKKGQKVVLLQAS